MAAATSVTKSGNAYVDGVMGDYRWASPTTLTYSFPGSASYYGANYGGGEPQANFAALNATQQQMVKNALAAYAAVANLKLTEVTETATSHADIRVALSDKTATGWTYFPSSANEGGDAWLNKSSGNYSVPQKGNYAYMTFLHELGHAMGLEHPHENGEPKERDSIEYTVMSYRSYVGAPTANYLNETWGYAQSLMMLDIAAVQQMYGANFGTNAGNTTYSWSPTTGEMTIDGIGQGAPGANRILLTVWDGGGLDTYDFSRYTTNLTVDLNPGGWTTTDRAQLARLNGNGSWLATGNIANALLYQGDLRSLIENAKGGSGNDKLIGNLADNTLWGNAGNDTLTGGAGNDLLYGGTGGDRLDGGAGIDTVSYEGATARVAVDLKSPLLNAGEASGDSYFGIEQVVGSKFADSLAGDDNANGLGGLAGDDSLSGRGGDDWLVGGDGNDTLNGGAGADQLDGGAGIDTADYSSALVNRLLSLSLNGVTADLLLPSANTGEAAGDTFQFIENLTGSGFSDSLRGSDAANRLDGGAGDDVLVGRGGADTLIGGAGNDKIEGDAGADTLTGGLGADTFYFFATTDSNAAAGRDTITDFLSLTDRIDLKGIDANSNTAGDQAFTYLGAAHFTHVAGQLLFADGMVQGDVNGDGVADFQLTVKGVALLGAADFIL